ncbi:two-component system chemotaxis response regulator CheY [Litorivivens lipolytica]|uniref:diguanylate cyclase n=2 Tax=Litorivivens lipolytica TaxID=1524264 RepID=A0A7W4Z5W9_9GAMM|nr:diguanylate cyclase [Litorivivens lipolytica]MBB3046325.1 two-component system chemotaxis response regulator CheY [Litorivivens lipolytica]
MTKILAIDDTPYNLDILKNGLEDEGFDMVTAQSGREGLMLIDQERPDLVLLDIGMPEMDGHQVLQQIRLSDEYGDLPVIILTANTEDSNLARCLESGANDYVTKPFSFTALVARVNNVLRTQKDAIKLTREAEKLRDLAYRDEMTGLLNRRAFFERANAEFEIAKSAREPLSVAILDIDHFKQINDTYGHPKGDDVLRAFGKLLKSSLRLHDVVGRIGGEEFAVLLPNSKPMDAYNIFERLRTRLIKEHLLSNEDGTIRPVTVSSGIVGMTDQKELDGLMILADMALYRAKNQGRNRTIVETGVTS